MQFCKCPGCTYRRILSVSVISHTLHQNLYLKISSHLLFYKNTRYEHFFKTVFLADFIWYTIPKVYPGKREISFFEFLFALLRIVDGFQTHCQKMFFYVYDKHLDLAEAISLAVCLEAIFRSCCYQSDFFVIHKISSIKIIFQIDALRSKQNSIHYISPPSFTKIYFISNMSDWQNSYLPNK